MLPKEPLIKKSHRLKVTTKDNSFKTTRNKVLDRKTITIIEKLKKRKILTEVNGCISSGKEAEIYVGKIDGNPNCNFIQKKQNMLKSQFKSNSACNPEGLKKENPTKERFLVNSTIPIEIDSSFSPHTESDGALPNVPKDNMGSSPQNVVLKIFRTSTLQFKNRSMYLSSESRYPQYRRSNCRQMIKKWAEKEVRNLMRLYKNGIKTARPIYLKRNIIIMEMIGTDEQIAIRLKDISICKMPEQLLNISPESIFYQNNDHNRTEWIRDDFIQNAYLQALNIIHQMYNKANIIHCDLSEYNLLLFNGLVYVIDVGQSVDVTHRYADVFLINDIRNINNFFQRLGVTILDYTKIYKKITNKQASLQLNGNEMNKFGFEIDKEILLKKPSYSENSSDEESFSSTSSSQEVSSSYDDPHETTDIPKKNINSQFTKNKYLSKDEKLERRKLFKHDRKMKRMCRDNKTTTKKKIQKRK